MCVQHHRAFKYTLRQKNLVMMQAERR